MHRILLSTHGRNLSRFWHSFVYSLMLSITVFSCCCLWMRIWFIYYISDSQVHPPDVMKSTKQSQVTSFKVLIFQLKIEIVFFFSFFLTVLLNDLNFNVQWFRFLVYFDISTLKCYLELNAVTSFSTDEYCQ